MLATDMSFTLTHTLDPVMTSHAGQYTCRASVMIASVSVNVSDHNNSNLTVQSTLVATFIQVPFDYSSSQLLHHMCLIATTDIFLCLPHHFTP